LESSWKRLSLAAVLSIMGLLATEIWYQNQSVSSLQTTAETAIAFISKSYDEISRRPTGKSNFVLINSGDLVFSGDTIATGPRGEIRIQFNNGERFLDLEPESMILIEDSNEETSLSLLSGSLFVTSNSEEGKSITLQNGNSKVDLSKATAQISKGSNNKIDLQVIKGRAILKKEGSDDVKEITSGNSSFRN
jgi:ferric-dicitrate binding protein FerR (iron transport regulator)